MAESVDFRSPISDLLGRPIPPEGELRVWLDDDPVDRKAPPDWIHLRSVREVCFALLTGRVIELSLDNDLNNSCTLEEDGEAEIARREAVANENLFGTGFQVLDFLEDQHFGCDNPLWPRDGIAFHTANASAEKRMVRAVEAVGRREGISYRVTQKPGERKRHRIQVGA